MKKILMTFILYCFTTSSLYAVHISFKNAIGLIDWEVAEDDIRKRLSYKNVRLVYALYVAGSKKEEAGGSLDLPSTPASLAAVTLALKPGYELSAYRLALQLHIDEHDYTPLKVVKSLRLFDQEIVSPEDDIVITFKGLELSTKLDKILVDKHYLPKELASPQDNKFTLDADF